MSVYAALTLLLYTTFAHSFFGRKNSQGVS